MSVLAYFAHRRAALASVNRALLTGPADGPPLGDGRQPVVFSAGFEPAASVFPASWSYKVRLWCCAESITQGGYFYLLNVNGFYYLDTISLYYNRNAPGFLVSVLLYKPGSTDYYDSANYDEVFRVISPQVAGLLDKWMEVELRYDSASGTLTGYCDNVQTFSQVVTSNSTITPVRGLNAGNRGGGGGGYNAAAKLDYIRITNTVTGEVPFALEFNERDTQVSNSGTLGGSFAFAAGAQLEDI